MKYDNKKTELCVKTVCIYLKCNNMLFCGLAQVWNEIPTNSFCLTLYHSSCFSLLLFFSISFIFNFLSNPNPNTNPNTNPNHNSIK